MAHNWKLEKRFCKCGCGQSFKVLPTSKAHYASMRHETRGTKEELDGFFSDHEEEDYAIDVKLPSDSVN